MTVTRSSPSRMPRSSLTNLLGLGYGLGYGNTNNNSLSLSQLDEMLMEQEELGTFRTTSKTTLRKSPRRSPRHNRYNCQPRGSIGQRLPGRVYRRGSSNLQRGLPQAPKVRWATREDNFNWLNADKGLGYGKWNNKNKKIATPKPKTPKPPTPKPRTPKPPTPKPRTPKARTPMANISKARTPVANISKAKSPKGISNLSISNFHPRGSIGQRLPGRNYKRGSSNLQRGLPQAPKVRWTKHEDNFDWLNADKGLGYGKWNNKNKGIKIKTPKKRLAPPPLKVMTPPRTKSPPRRRTPPRAVKKIVIQPTAFRVHGSLGNRNPAWRLQ